MLESPEQWDQGYRVTMEVRSGVQNFEKDSQRFILCTGYIVSLQDFERKIAYGLKTSRNYCIFREIFDGNICVSKDKKVFSDISWNFATQFRGHSSPRPSQKYQE
jgi:hypothetical protein